MTQWVVLAYTAFPATACFQYCTKFLLCQSARKQQLCASAPLRELLPIFFLRVLRENPCSMTSNAVDITSFNTDFHGFHGFTRIKKRAKVSIFLRENPSNPC